MFDFVILVLISDEELFFVGFWELKLWERCGVLVFVVVINGMLMEWLGMDKLLDEIEGVWFCGICEECIVEIWGCRVGEWLINRINLFLLLVMKIEILKWCFWGYKNLVKGWICILWVIWGWGLCFFDGWGVCGGLLMCWMRVSWIFD